MTNNHIDNKKIIGAWTTYDLANSVYNLVITATIFPIYYNAITSVKDKDGNIVNNTVQLFGITFKNTALYDYAIAFAYLIVSLIIPVLSGIADVGGNKKSFMKFFCYLGAISCMAMYFFTKDNLGLGIFLAITACIGFSGSLVFYNAYLPEIASPQQQDKVSAMGFAKGYWGSAILLIINLVLVMKPEMFGFENSGAATRFAFITVGIWWIGFAQIPFYYLPNGEKKNKQIIDRKILVKGYKELANVFAQLKQHKNLIRFLPAFFIYSMGVQTVMLVANHFGANEIKMKQAELITTILILQFVAMIGAYLFSYTSRKLGNIRTLQIATIIWSLICIGTYMYVHTTNDFYIVAAFVGLVMGGIQSLSRSTYSKMLPETEDHASYFSFYDVCEKVSIVIGMAIFGFINENSNSMRTPVLALIIFFIAGFFLLIRVNSKDAEA
jgi:UMF1 family MFS transporter